MGKIKSVTVFGGLVLEVNSTPKRTGERMVAKYSGAGTGGFTVYNISYYTLLHKNKNAI